MLTRSRQGLHLLLLASFSLLLTACPENNSGGSGNAVPKAWGTAALIETDNASDASRPQIAVEASGHALAVWQQSDGTRAKHLGEPLSVIPGTNPDRGRGGPRPGPLLTDGRSVALGRSIMGDVMGLVSILIEQLCPDFGFAVQGRRMAETIRVPDLHLFMPGLLEFCVRCSGREFEQRIVVGRPFVPH
jgi:hypothetical protein